MHVCSKVCSTRKLAVDPIVMVGTPSDYCIHLLQLIVFVCGCASMKSAATSFGAMVGSASNKHHAQTLDVLDDIETISFNAHPTSTSTATKMRNMGYFSTLRTASPHKSQYNKVADMDVSAGKSVFNPAYEEGIELSEHHSGKGAVGSTSASTSPRTKYMSINEPHIDDAHTTHSSVGAGATTRATGTAVHSALHSSTSGNEGNENVVPRSRAEDEQEMIRVRYWQLHIHCINGLNSGNSPSRPILTVLLICVCQ